MDNIENVIILLFDPTLSPNKKTELGIFFIIYKHKLIKQ